MLRKLCPAVVCVAAVVLVTGVALAVPPVFVDLVGNHPFGGPNPDAVGSGFLNYIDALDETSVGLRCAGLDLNASYDVYLVNLAADPAFFFIGSFTTNGQGRGTFHASVAGDRSLELVAVIIGGEFPFGENVALLDTRPLE